jgi:threonine synthase
MRGGFWGASVSEADTSEAILNSFRSTGELIDPHTAVGLAAADRAPALSPGTPLIALCTAHAAKFSDAVESATGIAPMSPRAAELAARPERFDRLPADAEAVKAYVRAFAAA